MIPLHVPDLLQGVYSLWYTACVGLENYQRCPECGSIATASSLVYDGKRDTFTFLGYRCFSCEATWNDRLTNDRESQ